MWRGNNSAIYLMMRNFYMDNLHGITNSYKTFYTTFLQWIFNVEVDANKFNDNNYTNIVDTCKCENKT